MRFAGTFRFRNRQLVLTFPVDTARIIAQAKGYSHPEDLHGTAVFAEVDL